MNELNFTKYANNEADNIFFYKIGLIGPSRVGKTSIIAALLDEAKTFLAKSGVSITPFVEEDGTSSTKERIRSTILDIEAGLDFCSFEPTGIGTAEPFIFDLVMSLDQDEEKNKGQLRLAILDYPGGWLKDAPPGDMGQKTWEKCQKWLRDSSVIIVPIDATLVMEADNKDRAKAARELLQVWEVEELLGEWAKGRWNQRESGLLLLVPVKCETYFNDNGGNEDKSNKLFDRINNNFYHRAIEAAVQELSEIEDEAVETPSQPNNWRERISSISEKINKKPPTYSIQYHPVDTIGCIELSNATWEDDKNGKLYLKSEYLVRNPGTFRPKRKTLGTIGLLGAICRQIVENRNNRGVVGKLWDWFTGINKLLADAIKNLSQKQLGARAKTIANGNIAKRG